MSNVLIVHAHPEPKSLTSALKNLGVDNLTAMGHTVQVSDLFGAHWKAIAPIPFRTQNGGHYDGQQVLKPGLGSSESGMRIHLVQLGDPEERKA